MSFDFEEPLELGAAQSQARRPNYAYTFSEPAPKHK